jgi:hypothetical protein
MERMGRAWDSRKYGSKQNAAGADSGSRPLRDLPANYQGNFNPTTFVPRNFLINMRQWVKPELRDSILMPPPDVAGYENDGFHRRAVTWEMIKQRRREKQKQHLEELQREWEYIPVRRIPMYVWVFFCPGVGGFAYRGWWLYIKGRDTDEGFRSLRSETIKKVMELFPLVQPSLFCKYSEYDADVEEWKREFVKKYAAKKKWCDKPQGKAPVWAEVSNHGIKILERAEWPRKGTL